MSLSGSKILQLLDNAESADLRQLPVGHGIYGLRDHTGTIRYIGETADDRRGFRGRISNRHVTGSEGRSHKFCHAYNTGRMWRLPKDSAPDARMAKQLRSQFIRRYCSASIVPIPGLRREQLRALEDEAIACAPREWVEWNNSRHFQSLDEPSILLDVLIGELALPQTSILAIERQADRHRMWKNSQLAT